MNEVKRKREPSTIVVSRKALRELIDEAVERAFRRRYARVAGSRGGRAKAANRAASQARVETPTKAAPTEGLARIKEACEFLACSRWKIDALVKAGDLTLVPLGRHRRLRWEELRRYVDGQ